MAKRTRNKSAAATELQRDSRLGRELDGRYRIEEQLGAGGVGAVYRATQLALGRPVAIKILHEGVHPSFTQRFEREAKALAALRHPNIVAVTDFGVCEGTPFLVMELLEGETLHYRLSQGLLPWARVLELTRQMLRAVGFVHEQGLVHRDLKPGNLFLEKSADGEQRLKLLDFGLAKFVQEQAAGTEGEAVTRAGDIVGTPAYIAPEQVAGDKVDMRADTYAIGVMLFQMLANRVPYEGEPVEQLKAHLVSPVPVLGDIRKDVQVRPELEAFLARAMAKQRDARFQNCNEMLEALEAIPTPWFGGQQTPAEKEAALQSTLLGPVDSMAPPPVRKPVPQSPSTQTIVRRVTVAGPIVLFLISAGAMALVAFLITTTKPEPETAAARAAVEEAAPEPAPRRGSGEPAKASAARAPEVQTVAAPAPAAAAPPAAQPAPAAAAEPAPAAAPPAPAAEDDGLTLQDAEERAPDIVIALNEAERPPARNPWARDVPKWLAQLRKAVNTGERGNDRTVAALRKHSRQNPQDARGHLLLAQLYRNRGWRADVLNQYSIAYQRDPSSRGAPEMLRDLIKLVVEGPAAQRAAILIRHTYGREALPAIERNIAQLSGNGPALARMSALRAAIAGS